MLLNLLNLEDYALANPTSLGSLSGLALPVEGGIITFTGKW
jgi:hypothetical protein